MPTRLSSHLTYANVMATLAVFIALGGTSYAVATITGDDVRNRSLTGRELKKNSVGGGPIKESRLGTVPNARRLNGVTAARLLIKCPPGTFPAGGTCIEEIARPAAGYASAVRTCGSADGDKTAGRRLPTLGELIVAYTRIDPAPGGELTGHVYPRADGNQDVLYTTSKTGTTAIAPDDGTAPKPYRCAIDPLN